MTGRTFVLLSALGVLLILAALTVYVLITDGLDVLVVASLVILALFASAVAGALRQPPE